MTRLVLRRLASLTLLALSLLASPARAALERHGPIVAAHGYPAWYQDKTGLTLEFCIPNAAELAGGHCLLLPGDTTVPEAFPAPFADEHFYWAGGAVGDWTAPGFLGARAELVLGLEAAFAIGPVVAGDQVTFGRLRLRLDGDKNTGLLPFDGDYTFYTPYGKYVINALQTDGRIFFTEDIGFQCPPGHFDCALQSSLGPFLLPSDFPGGPELPAFVDPAIPGNLYVADPARSAPVTGSVLPPWQTSDGPRNANVFRVEGPGGVLLFETFDFSLMGRIYQGEIVSRVVPKRASYTRGAGGAVEVDAYVVGEPTMQQRLPTEPFQPPVPPALRYYNAPCVETLNPVTGNIDYSAPVGETPITMIPNGTQFWNMSQPAALPAGICYHDVGPNQFLQGILGDQVVVSAAVFDPSNGGSLSVRAVSSDAFLPPGLSVGAFGALTVPTPMVNGLAYITPVTAPPESVRVFSMGLGQAELQVTRGVRAATGVTLTADLPSPQLPNSAIIFAAQGQGASNYLYRFRVNGTTVQDWSPTSTWTMIDLPEGNYSVVADVWLGLTPNAPDASSAPIAMQLRNQAATGVTLTASKPSPQVAGTAVTFTAAGQGSSGYDYRFSLSTNNGPYVLVQDYGNGATWALPTSTAVGNYRVKVDTRTSTLVAVDATTTMDFSISAVGVAVAASLTSPQLVGTTVTFTASPVLSGVPFPFYQYRFWLYTNGVPAIVQDWSETATWVLPGGTAGSFTVQADIRVNTTGNRNATAQIAFVIQNPFATGVLLTPSLASPQAVGTAVTFTAEGQGSTAAYQYRFWLWSGATVTLVQDWSASATWALVDSTPAGTYIVQVDVRTNSSSFAQPGARRDASTTRTHIVMVPFATGVTLTPSVASPSSLGTDVVFTAEGQGSSGYQYRFWRWSGTTATLVQDWSATPIWTMSGTSTLAGNYVVQVDVRTNSGVFALPVGSRDAFVTLNFSVAP
jgi:hypothetical protein